MALGVELDLSQLITDAVEAYLLAEDAGDRAFVLAALRTPAATGSLPGDLETTLLDVNDLYAQELENINGRFNILQDDIELVDELVSSEQATIRASIAQALTRVSVTLALGGATTVGAVVDTYVSPLVKNVSSTLHTNIAGYRSALEIRKASAIDDEPLFAYIGPNDSKTRPLCRHILRKDVYTLAEIAELDRHPDVQLEPVMIYGGGYNCRHRWIYTKRR